MPKDPLSDRIIREFEQMSGQLQNAARYILERPDDVALLSMREQARRAGVQPATMTRLAQFLGLEGYDQVRALYAEYMRNQNNSFAIRADAQLHSQRLRGERALAVDIVQAIVDQATNMLRPEVLDEIIAATRLIFACNTLFCLGLRSSHPVAWQVYYILSLSGKPSVWLDTIAGTGIDALKNATPQDAVMVVSVAPYTRLAVEVGQYATAHDIPLIAITDSAVAPLAKMAQARVLITTESPSFFHTMSPAFIAGEVIAALVAGRGGESTPAALRDVEQYLKAFNTHSDK
jgi:DNA-binding MurR/RpiR family transcriptional regulator